MGVYEINVPDVYSIMQANALYAYCGNNPISFIDLTGKWQEGDENLPDWAQDAIIEYTYNYNMSRSDEGREYFHQKAEMVRDFVENNYVSREEWNADDEKNDQWVEDPDKDVIVIHHTANNDTVQEIEQEHIEKFDGIGYHFVIGKDGTVYEGRTFDKKGSHVANANTGKIGIALIGDYYDGKWWEVWEWGSDDLPDSQKESLYVLVEILKDGQEIYEIGGHRDYKNGTVCPGNKLYDVVEDLK